MSLARHPFVECVPNFSEARRPHVVEAIVAAMSATGVRVLNVSSDQDHNRTVVTLVGEPGVVVAAAFAGIAKAADLINLDEHTGAHPRLGATDVVPFVPLRDVTLEECVALARQLGERVGKELGLPVYLYEAAATRPERTNLENVRRGQYEKLKAEIATEPKREPDYGPRQVGPAGAVIIGARAFLVAYNVYLNTADVTVAEKVARAVRNSSGGLHYVKAMGVLVDGQAQVSMNLTDFTQTPIARVVEFVRREAARYGAAITRSELVGMLPQAALVDAAQWYLQLDNLEPNQILENKLQAAEAADAAQAPTPTGLSPAFLDQLAAGTAAPGGGAAAAYAGAMAAALVSMVARLTLTKKKYAAVAPQMQAVLDQSERLRAELTAAADEDAAAFVAVMAAMQLPKLTPEEQAARAAAIQAGYQLALAVPLRVARAAVAALELAATAAEIGNLNAISDAGSAGFMAQAALRSAGLNVRANATELTDRAAADLALNDLAGLEARATAALAAIDRQLRDRH